MTWKDIPKTCVERYCELANKKDRAAIQKFQVLACMITISRRRNLNPLVNQIVLTCLYMARIGRLDILWSVNMLARSVTKWTGACDRRLAHLISYIHHTSDYRQYCHVGNTAQHCQIGSIPRLRLCWRLWGLKINIGVGLMYLWKSNICFY